MTTRATSKPGRRAFLAGAAALTAAPFVPLLGAHQIRRPNILVFLTDDHAQWLQGAYGNSEVRTPHLDGLARRGVRMTNAATPTPVCSPARASFFTGLYPSQHGIHDWIEESTRAYAAPWLQGRRLISERLKDAGYHTGLVGKWHCGFEREPRPGFDEWFSYWVDQYPHRGEQKFSDNGRLVTMTGQQSPLLTDRALGFLKGHRDGAGRTGAPFFLCVGYVDTHSPHRDAPEDLVALYDTATFRDIPDESYAQVHGRPLALVSKDAAAERRKRQQYYAAASSVDREVGRILADLAAHGELDDTLVVYTGDHGLNAGHHGLWEKGNITTPQNFLDESIRVACTLAWPNGGLKAGSAVDVPVNHCDLHATLLDAAGIWPGGSNPPSPGRSYLPWLRGAAVPRWRDAHICEYGNARMVRTRDHKLIRRYDYMGRRDPDELYDLSADPRETTNRFGEPALAGVTADLTRRIDEFFGTYEVAASSGLALATQPRATDDSPWLRPRVP